MTYQVKEILNLEEISVSSKSCKFTTQDCFLESKFGKVKFDLEDLPNKIVVHAKKMSGNGKIIINGEPFTVLSKLSYSCEISNISDELEITRPEDGIGVVAIQGISLYYEIEESNEVMNNWKALISKCGNYKNLRVINDKLFASSGGFIDNERIVTLIQTSPANQYTRGNGKIIFTGSCEIIKLEVDPNSPNILNDSFNLYEHINAAPAIVLNSENKTNKMAGSSGLVPTPQAPTQEIILPSNIIYDSSLVDEFSLTKNKQSNTISFHKSNGKNYLALKPGGRYSIPVSVIQSNSNYIIIVNGKKNGGSGKVNISFTCSDSSAEKLFSLQLNQTMTDSCVEIESGNPPKLGETFKLNIEVPNNGHDVLISRIQIIQGGNKFNSKPTAFRNNYNFTKKITDRRFVIVIPSYKNSNWCEKNIQSTIDQNYEKYRVIFTDDCSPDDTFDKVSAVVAKSNKTDKIKLIKNPERKGALYNLYHMIHSCEDDEIIVTLDGDDWLSDSDVLNKLNNHYKSGEVWMTYGQYQNHPDGGVGISRQIPNNIIDSNSFRRYEWCSSHLRTFYTWLFKKIDVKDLTDKNGIFYSMTWDFLIQFPQLEMAGHRAKFISDILYTYNLENPINDHKVDQKLQQSLDRLIRSWPPYQRLDKAPKLKCDSQTNVGLLLIATGKYHHFIQGLISSADNFFLNEEDMNVTYYVFSDKQLTLNTKRNVKQIYIPHKPFPFASMDRFKHFTNNAAELSQEDFLYYVDVDCLFVDKVSSREILGNLTSVIHCGYLGRKGPVEDNIKSVHYIDPNRYKNYYGGGFSGGKSDKYLALSKWCYESIEKDLANGLMPKTHDETSINTYFALNEPDVILTPSYHFPQGNINHYKGIWGRQTFAPKILLLDKNHEEIRG